MSKELFEAMADSVIDGDTAEAVKLAEQAIEAGIDPMEAIEKGYVVGIDHIGDLFGSGEIFLPELVMAGEAMKSAMSILEVEMEKQGTKRATLGKVILGTIEGDIHDIGKTLVGVMMSVNGFEVIDLGVDVAITKLVETARAENADIVAVSSLLTTTMARQRDLVKALKDAGMRDAVKVMVGGAPVTRPWVEEIGADGFSEDAVGAVDVAKQLLGVG